MAERGAGMRSSLSADDVGRPSNKPGKLSAEFLAQFESDPALSGSNTSLQFPHASPGHGSSSDMGSASASHEHLAPAKRHNVRISEPLPHSSNEEMPAGIEHECESDEKTEKKRKSIWKWGPLKKVRKFFSRKKGSRRAKSCEDLPVASTGFRTRGSQEHLAVDESLRYRTGSTPLRHEAEVHSKLSPVMRSRSMPRQSPNAKKRQTSSHEEICDERSPQPVSKTFSLPTLHSTGIRPLRGVNTEEAAVSFESDPNQSSIEGLQAAHDKIKAAPKKRRPPTRGRSRTSSLEVVDTPVTQDQKAHKRSRTDPTELTRERKDSGSLLNSSSMSDIVNNTIFETSEVGDDEDRDTTTSPQATQRDKEKEDEVKNEIMAKVNDILAQATGPSRLSPSTKLRANKVDLKKSEKDDAVLGTKNKETSKKKDLTVSEKRWSFPEKKPAGQEEFNLGRTSKEILERKEYSVSEKRRSFPEKKPAGQEEFNLERTSEEILKRKELPVSEKRRSFPDRKVDEKVVDLAVTKKETLEKKEPTLQEKRRSFTTDQKSKESTEKIKSSTEEKTNGFPNKESGSSFADSIRTSRVESEMVMAQNTCQLESEVTFEDFEFDKILDSEQPETLKKAADETKRESKVSPKRGEPQPKENTKPAVPFKRGKSWSNSHKPKFQEFPVNLDNKESALAKTSQTNALTEKREFVSSRYDQEKDEKKPSTSEESVSYRFSRTKSWSYGTKPGDVGKANAKENQHPSAEKPPSNEPAWVASAKQKSRRLSQLLQEDESKENQTPTLTKPNKNNLDKPPASSKSQTSPKPAPKAPETSGLIIQKDPLRMPVKPPKPAVVEKEQVKPSTQDKPSKSVMIKDQAKPTEHKPNKYGRNSATLPARTTKSTTGASVDKTSRQSLNLSSKDSSSKKPFGSVKIEKCIVCGTTVYQMEKCKFDDSVLHRNCIKCIVCKRHLTVGNFVMAESKIYCKPHSQTQTVAVST